jgi:hypothetical protein
LGPLQRCASRQSRKFRAIVHERRDATNNGNLFIKLKVTSWKRLLLEKLTVTQLLTKFPAFYGTEVSSLCSQVPVAGPYPEPVNPVHTFTPSLLMIDPF